MSERTHYYLLYGLVLVGLIFLIVLLDASDPDLQKTLIKEGGPIELLSAVGYFICLIMLFFLKVKDIRSVCSMMFILLIFGLRELDFHVSFTPMSMEKIKFYLSPDIPILAKIIGASIILAFLYSLFYLARMHLWDYIRAIKKTEPAAVGVLFGILFICIAKMLDGLQRKLADMDFTITNHVIDLTTFIEETLELGIPLMFMIAIMAHFHRSSPTRA